MTEGESPAKSDDAASNKPSKATKRRRRWGRGILITLVMLAMVLAIARVMAPSLIRNYVNRVLDRNPLYDGKIGDIELNIWRGAYAIDDIRLNKTTGNVSVPLFAAKKLDLAIQWNALLHRRIVGKVVIDTPELNFVDGGSDAKTQTGVGGPWLEMLSDLFPFDINSAVVKNGSVHFRAPDKKAPVDVFIEQLDASVENLSNIYDETTPKSATVKATGLAMGQAKFQYEMKLDPFSYYPTFDLGVRLIGLDVTKVNNLSRAYGAFDFEDGLFDLVVEVECKEGLLDGYVKALFRDLKIFSLNPDLKEDNVFQFFWEALVGTVAGVLKNPPRNQFGTEIPIHGNFNRPQTQILTVLGNVLRNAFVRAYLPRLEGNVADVDGLSFGEGSVLEPKAMGSD